MSSRISPKLLGLNAPPCRTRARCTDYVHLATVEGKILCARTHSKQTNEHRYHSFLVPRVCSLQEKEGLSIQSIIDATIQVREQFLVRQPEPRSVSDKLQRYRAERTVMEARSQAEAQKRARQTKAATHSVEWWERNSFRPRSRGMSPNLPQDQTRDISLQ